MKNFGLFLIGLVFSVISMTSCMEGGNREDRYAYGVLDYSSKSLYPLLKSSDGALFSSSIVAAFSAGDINVGDCLYVFYRIDYDLPENSTAVVNSNGYYTVTLLDYIKIPKYYAYSFLTDTSSILPNEMPVSKVFNSGDVLEGYFFISHTVNHPEDWEVSWNMSYDYATMLPTEENGKRYYDLFIRATVKKQGEKTSKVDVPYFNAYQIDNYMVNAALNEKSFLGSNYVSSSSTFTVRFNYVSSLDVLTNSITWNSHQIEVPISPFVSNY